MTNEVALQGRKSKTIFLDETGTWSGEYFDAKKFNCHRRQMFFVAPDTSWTEKAAGDADPFSKKTKSGKRKPGAKKPAKKPKPARKGKKKKQTAKRKKSE